MKRADDASPRSGRVHSIQVSDGGVPKLPVARARVGAGGLAGDRQRNRRHHGGPGRAVCLYSLEAIGRLRGEGHPIAPGTAGENLTIAGLDWSLLAPGVRLRVGAEVELEITSDARPCATIAGSFRDGDSTRIARRTNPNETRWYARVLRGGDVLAGDAVELA